MNPRADGKFGTEVENVFLTCAVNPYKGSGSNKEESKKMKKRTKIILRTKIYLTIVAVLALTGVFTPPIQVPLSPAVASTGPVGLAAGRGHVFVSTDCSQNIYKVDCMGNVSLFGTIPADPLPGARGKIPGYRSNISPKRPGSPRATFSSHKAMTIYRVTPDGTITPFASDIGCPFSDHSGITFDKVGTFGNRMIVACENGPVWTVDGNGVSHSSRSTTVA